MPTKAKKRKKAGEGGDARAFRRLPNLRAVSEHYGVPLATVEKMRARGAIEPTADSRWDTRTLDPAFANYKPRGSKGKCGAGDEELRREKTRAETERIKIDSQIKALKREAMRGQHLDADQARAGIEDAAAIIRKRVLALPASVAIHLYGLEIEAIEARLDKAVRSILLDLSEELQRPIDKLQAVSALAPDEEEAAAN